MDVPPLPDPVPTLRAAVERIARKHGLMDDDFYFLEWRAWAALHPPLSHFEAGKDVPRNRWSFMVTGLTAA